MRKLDRDLGLASVVAIAIGAMIGGGIFILPGLAATLTGPSLWLAYLISGILIIPAALSQSEMATAMPKAGGVYVFVDRSMGPMYGTIAGIGTWLAMMLKASFALVGIGTYLAIVGDVPIVPLALALLVGVSILNVVGVKKVGKFQIYVVILCAGALGSLAFKGSFQMDFTRLQPHFTNGGYGLLAATGLVFISYAGVTKIASIAEEIKNPARNLPLAMLLSLFLMMALYSGVSFILVGVLPLTGAEPAMVLSDNERPIALLGNVLFGKYGQITIAIIAVIALASMANAGLLAASRYPLAMSRDGMLPKSFMQVNEKYVTPVFSIIFTALCMAGVILFLPVVKIAKMASGMQVLLFMAINIAVIILRENQPEWYNPNFKSPLYPGIQIFGIISCLILLFMLGTFVMVGTGVLLVLGASWFFYYAHQKTLRRGVIQKTLMRPKPKRRSTATSKEAIQQQEQEPEIKKTEMVIALTDDEVSQEGLVRLASVIGAHDISMVHLVEIPEQTSLGAVRPEETPHQQAIERRIQTFAKRISVDVNIDFLVSHDRRHAFLDYVEKSGTSWVLREYSGSLRRTRNRMGWLQKHMDCQLALYKNAGIIITNKVLALMEQAPYNDLVLEAANKFAETNDAHLSLLYTLPEDATPEQIEEAEAFLAGCGQRCTSPLLETSVQLGERVETIIQQSIEHDLMVIGFPEIDIKAKKHTTHNDAIFEQAACSVLGLRLAKTKLPKERRKSLASTFPTTNQEISRISDLLDPRTIRTNAQAKDADALYSELGKLFAKVVGQPAESIEKAFRDTEQIEHTPTEKNTLLLRADLQDLKRTNFGLVLLEEPIDFPGKDHPIEVIICAVEPTAEHDRQVELLKKLSSLLTNKTFLVGLKIAHSTREIMELIRSLNKGK